MGKAAAIRFTYISVSFLVCLTGCNRYADFTLPVLAGSAAAPALRLNAQPVLSPTPGSWDQTDVLNPSVISQNGRYLNFYSGFDGRTWHTGLAESVDGVAWNKLGRILSPDPRTWEASYIAANGSALYCDTEYRYWYQAGPRAHPQIGLARSQDLRSWSKEPSPVLPPGPLGSWDEDAVADPDVIRMGDWFYLYYLGQNRARVQALGVARSRDGVHWEKLHANPILEPALPGTGSSDENGLGEPAVWQAGGAYWMLFTGRAANEVRTLGLARSKDGVHWTRLQTFRGAGWNSQVLCDPSVLNEANRTRLWFGGGDRASPDENLHGQIGEGEFTP